MMMPSLPTATVMLPPCSFQPVGIMAEIDGLAHAASGSLRTGRSVRSPRPLTPHRMGAALTYARRYALFTLVGIAGEDDLDAPDITACAPAASHAPDSRRLRLPPRGSGNGPLRSTTNNTAGVLDAGQSVALRDKLLAEVAGLASADSAVTWAARALPAKNSLVAADAKILEDAFEQKLSDLSSPVANDVSAEEGAAATKVTSQDASQASRIGSDEPRGVDKCVLAVAAPRRYRNREHLRFVARQPCLVCGRKPSDPHHLRYLQPRALGRKASDEFTVPLCRMHHRAAHRAGDERAWWKAAGIDPMKFARGLWQQTRVKEGRLPADEIMQTPQSGLALNSQPIGSTGRDIS
jgi:hypothetical protein